MSGVVSGIGKIFKDVVVKPFKESIKIGNEVKDYIMKSPILKAVVIAVAAYFTAGAALAYFGAAGAAAGGAAAAATDVAGGTAIGDAGLSAAVAGGASDAAATAAISGGVAAGADASVTAGAGILAADGGAAAAGTAADALSTGGAALSGAGDIGAAEGLAGGSSSAAAAGDSFFTGQAVTANALASGVDPATAAGYGSASSLGNASTDVMAQAGSNASNAISVGQGSVSAVQDLPATDIMPTVDTTGVETSGNFMSNSVSNVEQWAKGLFGGGTTPTTAAGAVAPSAAPATSSLLGDTTKMMLVQGGLQVASALLNKPQPQMQEAGVNSRGTGGGDMISATPGGFGLQMGGVQPVPGGVPIALQPKSPVAANVGMTASNYNAGAAVNSGVQSVNLAQNVAASAGVGGLVPQGSGTPGATAALAPAAGAA